MKQHVQIIPESTPLASFPHEFIFPVLLLVYLVCNNFWPFPTGGTKMLMLKSSRANNSNQVASSTLIALVEFELHWYILLFATTKNYYWVTYFFLPKTLQRSSQQQSFLARKTIISHTHDFFTYFLDFSISQLEKSPFQALSRFLQITAAIACFSMHSCYQIECATWIKN